MLECGCSEAVVVGCKRCCLFEKCRAEEEEEMRNDFPASGHVLKMRSTPFE